MRWDGAVAPLRWRPRCSSAALRAGFIWRGVRVQGWGATGLSMHDMNSVPTRASGVPTCCQPRVVLVVWRTVPGTFVDACGHNRACGAVGQVDIAPRPRLGVRFVALCAGPSCNGDRIDGAVVGVPIAGHLVTSLDFGGARPTLSRRRPVLGVGCNRLAERGPSDTPCRVRPLTGRGRCCCPLRQSVAVNPPGLAPLGCAALFTNRKRHVVLFKRMEMLP